MHRFTRAALAAAAIAALALGGAAAANAAPAIPLNNGQETTGAAGGAHGKFAYTINGTQFCYTLNNTAIACPRVLIAVLENYQNEDGSITVPTALRAYMNGLERIAK